MKTLKSYKIKTRIIILNHQQKKYFIITVNTILKNLVFLLSNFITMYLLRFTTNKDRNFLLKIDCYFIISCQFF